MMIRADANRHLSWDYAMKDILVAVTGGAHDEPRLANATDIARIFGSHVTVVVVNELPNPHVYAADPSVGVAAIDADLQRLAMSRGEELKQWTEEKLVALSSPASVVVINGFRANSAPRFANIPD